MNKQENPQNQTMSCAHPRMPFHSTQMAWFLIQILWSKQQELGEKPTGQTHPGRELQTDVLGSIAQGPAPAPHTSLFLRRCYNLSPFIASTHTFVRSSRKRRFKERSSFHWPDGLSPQEAARQRQDKATHSSTQSSRVRRAGLENKNLDELRSHMVSASELFKFCSQCDD